MSTALERAVVGFIDDPMSFPWTTIDLDRAPTLIVDASRCSRADTTALLPALAALTPADTVLNPADPTAIALGTSIGTRIIPPAPADWDQLSNARRIVVSERRILRRIEREIGQDAIVHRVELDALVNTSGGFKAHLATLAEASNAQPVGVWGVRSRPGAPLHHGIAVFTPEPAS